MPKILDIIQPYLFEKFRKRDERPVRNFVLCKKITGFENIRSQHFGSLVYLVYILLMKHKNPAKHFSCYGIMMLLACSVFFQRVLPVSVSEIA